MLRVALDARIRPGGAGGVQQAIEGLLWGLSQTESTDLDLKVLATRDGAAWLGDQLTSDQVVINETTGRTLSHKLGRRLSILRDSGIGAAATRMVKSQVRPTVPSSDGLVESMGVDVVHFLFQAGFLTSLPSIYCPHDLQHLHFPQHFEPRTVAWRQATMSTLCREATYVVALTEWGKRDLIEAYDLEEDQVRVIGWGSPLDLIREPTGWELEAVRRRFSLPRDFIFYPAATWPHKNHIGLLNAVAELEARKSPMTPITLVCSGRLTDHYEKIRDTVAKLGMEANVRFVGHVDPLDVKALYRLGRAMIFPSQFEGFGLPLLEAFSSGLPVACSTLAPLTEVGGKASLFFDANDPHSIASAIECIVQDETVRTSLVSKGLARAADFSWTQTARNYIGLYREAS